MTDFKFFNKNRPRPERRMFEDVANVPNIGEILGYLLRYCLENQENLFDYNYSGVIQEMEYGRFVFTSVDFPLNGEHYIDVNGQEVNIPGEKLDVLILFTPNDGGQSYYINPVQDYDIVNEEYEGFFRLPNLSSLYFTEETVDNYGNN